MQLQNVTLEVSLKPFMDMTDDGLRATAEVMFRQWEPLCRDADQVSVMLWPADGSEILEYRGRLDDTLEWACWAGNVNAAGASPGAPEGLSLHTRPVKYIDDPPEWTYGDLRRLVGILKAVGVAVTRKPTRVGATFDPGPEFAKSVFKYERHPEICCAGTMGPSSFVACYATLNADDVTYAGFPDGIPQDTTIGTFLGRQSQHFLTDLGFDYIWLSNGFGFGLETWALRGAVFDGKSFSSDRVEDVRDKIVAFWQGFRDGCPEYPIETRGTNLSTGMDLSSDAVPLSTIYRSGFGMEPPPNSPWAAINGDFGLEMIGWMSHIAELPGESFPFRFYPHDPWWNNSPWLDRYNREPHDIYLPLSVARINAEGEARTPTSINFLTVDDTWGQMPEIVPTEVIAHIKAARLTGPDAAGPLLWVYPFEEYHDMTYGTPSRIDEVFFGDWFMREAVDHGLPLNTVISTKSLPAVLERDASALNESVLVSPVPTGGSEWSGTLLKHVESGGRVMLYGPTRYADERLRAALNVAADEELDGECRLRVDVTPDMLHESVVTDRLIHPPLLSAGGMGEVLAGADADTTVLAEASWEGETRVAALTRSEPGWSGGRIVWVRGTVACDPERISGHLLVPYPSSEVYPAGRLMRLALQAFGYEILAEKRTPFDVGRLMETALRDYCLPVLAVARHRNGFFLAGHTPNTTVRSHLRFPQGAPLLDGYETELESGRATYSLPRAWRRQCRVFVEQAAGEVACRTIPASTEQRYRHRMIVAGLKGATLRFFHEPGSEGNLTMLRAPKWPYIHGEFLDYEPHDDALGRYVELGDVSGEVMISW